MANTTSRVGLPMTDQGFATTHWTVVLGARESGSPDAEAALEALCRSYWGALYAYVRRSGRSPADAADLTQAFFVSFLERCSLKAVDPSKGKFRSFLLKALNHFLADEWRRDHALKRGGSHTRLSLDTEDWESRFGRDLRSEQTPELLFERRWALALFARALDRLRVEFTGAGRSEEFDHLKEFLTQPSHKGAYSAVATQLGMEEGAVSVRVHRLRKRYRELVREEVARTVSTPGEVEEELRHLLAVLRA